MSLSYRVPSLTRPNSRLSTFAVRVPYPKLGLALNEGKISRTYRSAALMTTISGMPPEHAWQAMAWAISACASAAGSCRGTGMPKRLNWPREQADVFGSPDHPGLQCFPIHVRALSTDITSKFVVEQRSGTCWPQLHDESGIGRADKELRCTWSA